VPRGTARVSPPRNQRRTTARSPATSRGFALCGRAFVGPTGRFGPASLAARRDSTETRVPSAVRRVPHRRATRAARRATHRRPLRERRCRPRARAEGTRTSQGRCHPAAPPFKPVEPLPSGTFAGNCARRVRDARDRPHRCVMADQSHRRAAKVYGLVTRPIHRNSTPATLAAAAIARMDSLRLPIEVEIETCRRRCQNGAASQRVSE
jgi:hypothetical protein